MYGEGDGSGRGILYDEAGEVVEELEDSFQLFREYHEELLPPQDPVQLCLSREAAEEGMEWAERGAGEEYMLELVAAIYETARKYQFFTADNVWEEMPGGVCRKGDALGPAMIRAKKDGIIVRELGEHRASSRPTQHLKPQRVWRSLLYEE